MSKIWMPGGGGGADLDVITASAGDVLANKVIVDKDGEPLTGTLALSGTAADSQVLAGKTYYNTDAKSKRTGEMANRGAWTSRIGVNGKAVIPAGYHNGAGYVDQAITNRGAWTGSVGRRGKLTIPEGYHSGGGYVNGPSMTDKGAATYTPGRSNQSIGAGYYLTGAQTILGDANLLPQNIAKGKKIFGVNGDFEGYTTSPLYLYNKGSWSNLQTIGVSGISGSVYEYSGTDKRIAVSPNSVSEPGVGRLNQTINLSAYKYLKVNMVMSNGVAPSGKKTRAGIGVSTSPSSSISALISKTETTSDIVFNGILVADVGALSGNYYIYLFAYKEYNVQVTNGIYEIFLSAT